MCSEQSGVRTVRCVVP